MIPLVARLGVFASRALMATGFFQLGSWFGSDEEKSEETAKGFGWVLLVGVLVGVLSMVLIKRKK